jgi:hypothetical protein
MSESVNITGQIHRILDEEVRTYTSNNEQKEFKKRELVIIIGDQYPQHRKIEFQQDKCDILNDYSVGEIVEVGINLRGRAWTTKEGEEKYFNTDVAWRISKGESSGNSNEESFKEQPDDLPF